MADAIYGFAEAPDPKTRTCDWCRGRGAFAFEIYKPRRKTGSGQYVIACPSHKELAEISADPRKAEDAA